MECRLPNTPDLPIWAQWVSALAVPVAAIFGVFIGVFNFNLQKKRRLDDLFDRRFDLFCRISGVRKSFLDRVSEEIRVENSFIPQARALPLRHDGSLLDRGCVEYYIDLCESIRSYPNDFIEPDDDMNFKQLEAASVLKLADQRLSSMISSLSAECRFLFDPDIAGRLLMLRSLPRDEVFDVCESEEFAALFDKYLRVRK